MYDMHVQQNHSITTIVTQYDDYRNHTTIIGTTKQSQKYAFFRKFDVFCGKNGCDYEDKTYSNCYVLKYSEIVLPDTLNPLVHLPYNPFQIEKANKTIL